MFVTPYLAGRDTELNHLRQLLQPEGRTRIITLSGSSSVGKSALIIEAMHQNKALFENGALYLDLAGTLELHPFLVAINHIVSSRLGMLSAPITDELATDLLDILEGASILFVLDNVEASAAREEVLSFVVQLPPTCKVLLTSSEPNPKADANVIINPLSKEATWTLYQELRVDKQVVSLSSEDVSHFTKGYPATIILLASLDLKTFLSQLPNDKAFEPSLIVDTAYAALNAPAQTLAQKISLLPRPVSLALVSSGTWGDWQPLPARNQLQTYRLVECNALKCRMSSLVAQQIVNHISVETKIDLYQQLAAAYLDTIADALFEQEEVNWYVLDDQYPNMAAVLDRCYQAGAWQVVLNLSRSLNTYLQRVGWVAESLLRNQQGLESSRKLQNRQAESVFLYNLGMVLHDQGRLDESETCYRDSLVLCRALGDHSAIAQSLQQLGRLHLENEDWQQAEDFLNESLSIWLSINDDLGQGQTYYLLGMLAQRQQDFTRAMAWYRKSLAIAKRSNDRYTAAQTLNNRGWIYDYQGQYDKAINDWGGAERLFREIGSPLANDVKKQIAHLRESTNGV